MQFGADLASKLEVSYFMSCEWTLVQVRANPGHFKTNFLQSLAITHLSSIYVIKVTCLSVCVCLSGIVCHTI